MLYTLELLGKALGFIQQFIGWALIAAAWGGAMQLAVSLAVLAALLLLQQPTDATGDSVSVDAGKKYTFDAAVCGETQTHLMGLGNAIHRANTHRGLLVPLPQHRRCLDTASPLSSPATPPVASPPLAQPCSRAVSQGTLRRHVDKRNPYQTFQGWQEFYLHWGHRVRGDHAANLKVKGVPLCDFQTPHHLPYLKVFEDGEVRLLTATAVCAACRAQPSAVA